MAKQQNALPSEIAELVMYIEIHNSKMILKTVENLNIPNPNILEILDTFEQNNIPVYYVLNNPEFHTYLVQDPQSILEFVSLYDSSSDAPDLMGVSDSASSGD